MKNINNLNMLWYLQQHLTYAEQINLAGSHFCWSQCSVSLQQKIQIIYQDYLQWVEKEQSVTEFLLLQKTEVESLINKKLPTEFPLVISYKGQKNILLPPKVAIVGARHPTLYGRQQAYYFAKELASQGVTVISGGAIGIDAIANQSAFSSGNSCAVLGSGLQQMYPPCNRPLFTKMSSQNNGMVISEFLPQMSAQKWFFPKRNLTIACLADAILVIEGTIKSGSLITAQIGCQYGIPVGAVPGPVDSALSEGPNHLISMGAHCIVSPQNMLSLLL